MSSQAPVEVLDEECYLIRDFLESDQQAALFQYIQERDKTPWDSLPRAMVPAPKTLLLGEDQPSLTFEFGEASLIADMVVAATDLLPVDLFASTRKSYRSISMATIRYEATEDARFPPHVDHCDNSYVYLASLGCTANFLVKGPRMAEKRTFKFRSGDLLVFNASTSAALLHGVCGIDEASCPHSLAERLSRVAGPPIRCPVPRQNNQ